MGGVDYSDDNRANLISVITSPLGFFALALLIIEGFLGIVLIFSGLGSSAKFAGLIIGASLFIIVVGAVFVLVWFKPKSLTFGEHGHLAEQSFGTSDNPKSKATTLEESAATPTT